jgi:hypothetical protein
MGVSLESVLNAASAPGQIAGRSLDEWNAAYVKVESYFHALRVRNKLLLGELVTRVIERAVARAEQEPERAAMQLAAQEMDFLVSEWFAAVLNDSRDASAAFFATRGRLALLLADMPGKWQDQFLKAGPWPDEFIRAMREAYLRAGPDFQFSQMSPRPLDLGPIAMLTNQGDVPYFRMILSWLAFAGLLVVLFKITH